MNIIDAAMIILLALGAIIGWKRGFIESSVRLVGTILTVVLAFILKNPLSVLMYQNLPFFKLGGIFKGISVINILIYEVIAFVIVFILLKVALFVLVRLSKVLEKILKATIIMILPSKILGMILGMLEFYLIIFVALFVFNQFNLFDDIAGGSKYGNTVLTKTPFLSTASEDLVSSLEEIGDLKEKYDEAETSTKEFNTEALDVLLKYDIITKENADKLIEKGKIEVYTKEEMENLNEKINEE